MADTFLHMNEVHIRFIWFAACTLFSSLFFLLIILYYQGFSGIGNFELILAQKLLTVGIKVKKEGKMNREKKLSLKELKVQSFSTTLSKDEKKAIKGGDSTAVPGTTSIKIYC